MRILILTALLFAFTASGFVDIAHASAADHNCAHHKADHDNHAHDDHENGDHAQNEPCPSEHSTAQCNDCCCVHTHSMQTSVTLIKMPTALKLENIIASYTDHYSAELAGLKRPPRL